MPTSSHSAQDQFNKNYITSSEICKELNVTRKAVLMARRSGVLPNPIVINDNHIYIWDRVSLAPHLASWILSLTNKHSK